MTEQSPNDANILSALIDDLLTCQRLYDRELFCGFSHSRRDELYAEVESARDTLINFIKVSSK